MNVIEKFKRFKAQVKGKEIESASIQQEKKQEEEGSKSACNIAKRNTKATVKEVNRTIMFLLTIADN